MAGELLDLRRGDITDFDDLIALRDQLASWMVEHGIDQWVPGTSRRTLRSWLEAGHVFVLDGEDDRPAAAVAVLWEDDVWPADRGGDAGYVHLLMVDRSLAGRAVGRWVLRRAETYIAGKGMSLARLDVPSTNQRLQAYYRSQGYQPVGEGGLPEWDYVAMLMDGPLTTRQARSS